MKHECEISLKKAKEIREKVTPLKNQSDYAKLISSSGVELDNLKELSKILHLLELVDKGDSHIHLYIDAYTPNEFGIAQEVEDFKLDFNYSSKSSIEMEAVLNNILNLLKLYFEEISKNNKTHIENIVGVAINGKQN